MTGRVVARRRPGMSFLVLMLVIFAIAGIGLALTQQARQGSRASHWFYHAQLAYDLADAGIKTAFAGLTEYNDEAEARKAPFASDAFVQAIQALKAGGGSGDIRLFASDGALPPPLAALLADAKDWSPTLTVTLRILATEPLWTGFLSGIPAVPEERRGLVQVIATAHVKTPVGTSIDRTITLEKAYKVINLVPPLLGRFGLFVHGRGAGEINNVPMTFDSKSGDSTYDGAVQPIVLRSAFQAPALQADGRKLDRSAFVKAIPDPKFLDKQGWVYLGAEPAKSWGLHIAHGFGVGESPLILGRKRRELYRGSKSEDDAFTARFKAAFDAAAEKCEAFFLEPEYGLYRMQHGFATNYELIGVSPGSFWEFRKNNARITVKFPNQDTAALRLFGTADALSPTLVFGPVYQTKLQRAALRVNMARLGICDRVGTRVLNLYRLEEHDPAMVPVLAATFGSAADFKRHGTTLLEDEPFATALNVVLNPQGSGTYATTGALQPDPGAAPAIRPFTSELLPWLGTVPQADGLGTDRLTRLASGELSSERVYKGNLSGGLKAFCEALLKKSTFSLKPEAFRKRVLVDGELKVPGVAVVDQNAPLVIDEVKKVSEGGILMTAGPIHIKGNIARGGKEPLTLVSLKGEVLVDSAVTQVDAYLVAVDGPVKILGAATVSGVAGRELDVSVVANAPGKRTIAHAADMDPTGPNRTLLRSYFGGDDRIAVTGVATP